MTFSACEVTFDNVPVPLENVIGEVGGGFKVRFGGCCWPSFQLGFLVSDDTAVCCVCNRLP